MTWQALVPLIVLVLINASWGNARGSASRLQDGRPCCGAVPQRPPLHDDLGSWGVTQIHPLGWVRLQRCPVGYYLTIVTPVKDSDLTVEEGGLPIKTAMCGFPTDGAGNPDANRPRSAGGS
jgi:hypothetical protein